MDRKAKKVQSKKANSRSLIDIRELHAAGFGMTAERRRDALHRAGAALPASG